jgi:hypothetical protein
MSTVSKGNRSARGGILPLHNGDRMTQAEFHQSYLACREDEEFELIGGI